MKQILILGCGRSSSTLIQYLLKHSNEFNWHIRVGDADENLASEKIYGFSNASSIKFDIFDAVVKEEEINKADLVISMLPAKFHIEVLKACIKYRKNMLSASYISEEIKALEKDINDQGILVLKECGLDPGLDHMSAMQIIDEIKDQGGEITSFRSYTGGLVAPEYDNNPWSYKFSWNPRNVILAGQGTASFISNKQYKYIPYHKLFSRTDKVTIAGWGDFEGYANRDSLSYRQVYGLEKVATMLRGTLRKPGFCKAWDVFVQLGMTDDSYKMKGSELLTNRSFLNAFLPYDDHMSIEEKFSEYWGMSLDSKELEMFRWLGLFEDVPVSLENASPAMILQKILESKWVLEPHDKDMIIMQHQFEYIIGKTPKKMVSDLVVVGEDTLNTAMSKTVGLPLAIVSRLLLLDKLTLKGLHIPTAKEVYEPVMLELKNLGIAFNHK
ncbi:MAG: saccharopine dehydrogenase NADP-binding domain-containing protein [Bacteroidota bacterium]|nr:saccharopine dehydrogenase NADP-binding domain-containing protein [Bacteroidota bacterium]